MKDIQGFLSKVKKEIDSLEWEQQLAIKPIRSNKKTGLHTMSLLLGSRPIGSQARKKALATHILITQDFVFNQDDISGTFTVIDKPKAIIAGNEVPYDELIKNAPSQFYKINWNVIKAMPTGDYSLLPDAITITEFTLLVTFLQWDRSVTMKNPRLLKKQASDSGYRVQADVEIVSSLDNRLIMTANIPTIFRIIDNDKVMDEDTYLSDAIIERGVSREDRICHFDVEHMDITASLTGVRLVGADGISDFDANELRDLVPSYIKSVDMKEALDEAIAMVEEAAKHPAANKTLH